MAVAIVVRGRFAHQVITFDDETAARAHLASNPGLRNVMLRTGGETGEPEFLAVDESNITPPE